VNVNLPRLLASLTRREGIKFVHFSSDSVYSGNANEAPFAETSPTFPFSLYGTQKLRSEEAVIETNPAAVVARVNFFGWSPDGTAGILDHFVSHALRGSRPVGYPNYFVTSLYTGDLAEVVAAAVRNDTQGIFNIGSSDTLSKFSFGQEVFRSLGLDPDQIIAANPSAWESAEVSERNLSMSAAAIEAEIGIRLPTQVDGIHKALDGFKFFQSSLKLDRKDPRQRVSELAART
jgi:dTDP-4-dehydrorhamnose reductase